MKRDPSLVRKIAFAVEDLTDPVVSSSLVINDFPPSQVNYHCGLMHDDGMFDAWESTTLDSEGREFMINGLSSKGHDFVELARNDTVWNKFLSVAKDKIPSLTIDGMMLLLKSVAN